MLKRIIKNSLNQLKNQQKAANILQQSYILQQKSQNYNNSSSLIQKPQNNFFWLFKNKDAYQTLGITPQSSEKEIKAAYKMCMVRVEKQYQRGPTREKEQLKIRQAYEEIIAKNNSCGNQQQQAQNPDNSQQQTQQQQEEGFFSKQNQNSEKQQQKQEDSNEFKQKGKFQKYENYNNEDDNLQSQQAGSKQSLAEFIIFAMAGTILLCTVAAFAIKDQRTDKNFSRNSEELKQRYNEAFEKQLEWQNPGKQIQQQQQNNYSNNNQNAQNLQNQNLNEQQPQFNFGLNTNDTDYDLNSGINNNNNSNY